MDVCHSSSVREKVRGVDYIDVSHVDTACDQKSPHHILIFQTPIISMRKGNFVISKTFDSGLVKFFGGVAYLLFLFLGSNSNPADDKFVHFFPTNFSAISFCSCVQTLH